MPIVAPPRVSTIAFDFTVATARQANVRSTSSAAVGARLVTTFHGISPVGTRMRSCSSTPPRTRFMSMPPVSPAGNVPISTRRFFLRPSSSAALSAIAGATMHSRKSDDIATAVASSMATEKATTPPKADVGSQANAFCHASSGVAPMANPHGVVCLMIAQATCSANGSMAISAPSTSSRLLKLSSLPPSCVSDARPAPARST